MIHPADYNEFNGCIRKVNYTEADFKVALRQLYHLRQKSPERKRSLRVYQCLYEPDHYHIGHYQKGRVGNVVPEWRLQGYLAKP